MTQSVEHPNSAAEAQGIVSFVQALVSSRPQALGEWLAANRLDAALAAWLQSRDLEPGARVAIMLPNVPQFAVTMAGVLRAGYTCVNVNPLYTARELEHQLKDSGASVIVVLENFAHTLAEVIERTQIRHVVIASMGDLLGFWYGNWITFAVRHLAKMVPAYKLPLSEGRTVTAFNRAVAEGAAMTLKSANSSLDSIAFLQYTGGTTGLPKGCQCSHSGIVSMVNDTQEVTEGFITEGEDVVVYSAPLFHQFGQTMFFAIGLCRGNPTVLMPTPDVDATLDAIEQYKGTLFLGVPALYRMILENDRFDRYDLSSLRYCWSGGDVLPREVYNRWKEHVGVPIYQVYGATECGFTCLSPLDSEPVPGTIGRPIPSRAIKLVDPEGTDEVPPGETGELLVHSDTLPPGYWNKPQETAESFVEIDDRVWYRTKDYCRLGEDGLVYYVDRAADVIKYKGYRVSASEIESVLQSHPLVIGACVVGVPDPRVGERIKAIVVLKEDAKGVGSQELMGFCRGRLAAYKMPKYIEFRDMLPKSKVGKLLRREIRDEERRKTGD